MWRRLGFEPVELVLAQALEALETRLGDAPVGPSRASTHVQSDDRASVERAISHFFPRLAEVEVRDVAGGWIRVVDPVLDGDRDAQSRLAADLSDRLGVVVVALALEHGAVVRYRIYERGLMVDEYLSLPAFYGELDLGEALACHANPTIVARADRRRARRGAPGRADGRIRGRPSACRGALRGDRGRDGSRGRPVRLYDAPRCPFCARVRLALAEKGVPYETVEIDLRNRPPGLYDLNALGKVPVLEDGIALPESAVILEYPRRVLPRARAPSRRARLRAKARVDVFRFDELLGDDYYAFRRGQQNAVAERLDALPVGESLFVDFAYLPWVVRLRELYAVELPDRLEAWLAGLASRPAVAAEFELVRGLA